MTATITRYSRRPSGKSKWNTDHAIIDVDVTQFSSQSRLAEAREFVDSIDASRSRHARHRLTLVYVYIAVFPHVPQRTYTLVIVNLIDASCVVVTRHRQTLIKIQVTPFSSIARHAVALEAAVFVDADAVVTNRHPGRFALVNILFAKPASVTGRANAAGRVIFPIHDTRSPVFARLLRTRVHIDAAVVSDVPRRATTFVFVHQVHADLALRAGNPDAIVDVPFASVPLET